MATAGDIREIMEIPQEGPPKPAPKKVRVDPGPRLTGFQREVQALMNDSHNVPPIPIVDNARYKAKPTYAPRAFKTRKWEERRFINGARTDGLELRHWKHTIPPAAGQRLLETPVNGTNVLPDPNGQTNRQPILGNGENVNGHAAAPIRYDDEFPMEKFNVKVNVPSYTPEQYEAHFKSEDWAKEETDYLLGLCRDFDMRWIVVADRYDPNEIPIPAEKPTTPSSKEASNGQTDGAAVGDAMVIDQNSSQADHPTGDSKALSVKPAYPPRSMEALKARYYTIASKMLSINTPPDTMTPSEFGLWEKMKSFDARTEESRKQLAEKLFMRTKEEADEERILLEELARITKNEDDFLKMRKDLYQRLETPVLNRRAEDQGTAIYQTSSGLGALLTNLLRREKGFKKPSMIDTGRANSGQEANGEAERGTAGTATDRPRKQTWEKGQHPNQYTARRNTMDAESANGDGPKKTGGMAQTPNLRTLTPAEEAKYGVAHPTERITSGVQFRHEKASKVVLSKSAAQMAKIQAALVELGIPVRLLMPTERVCKEYERLVADIVLLLDARRAVEKVSSEVRVLEESRRVRLGLSKDGEAEDTGEKMDVDQEGNATQAGFAETPSAFTQDRGNAEADAEGEADDDAANEDATANDEEEDEDGSRRAEANTRNERSGINAAEDGEDDRNDDDAEADEERNDNEDADPTDDVGAGNEAEAEPQNSEDDEEYHVAGSLESEDAENENEDPEAEASAADNDNDNDNDHDQDEDEDEDEGDEEAEAEASGPDNDQEDNDEEAEPDEEEKPQQPSQVPTSMSVPARLSHKRSASVISEGSRAGSGSNSNSNRSVIGRKKGRK